MPAPRSEPPRPLSESRLWGLLANFYDERGADAWRSGTVPQRVTSNGYLADVYASVAGAFLRDWSHSGGTRTPLILEVGGGSGLFAWLFLNRLRRHQPADEPVPDFDYLLTDAAASNVEAWSGIPRLRSLVEAGSLHLGLLKIGGDVAVEPFPGGPGTDLDLSARPVILIANYVLDSVPSDLLRIRDGRVFRELIALEPGDGTGGTAAGLRGLTVRSRSEEIQAPYTAHQGVNEVIEGYRHLPAEACVPVPLETVAFLEHFLGRDFPFLMLAGDLAYTTADFDPEPPLILRDYGACTVNFHLLGRIFEQWGGCTRFGRDADSRLSVGAFIKPTSTAALPSTREVARTCLYHFTPYDAHLVTWTLETHPGPVAFRTVCAWLRLARFDAHTTRRCIPHLVRVIEEGEPFDADTLRESLLEAYRCDLPQTSRETGLDLDIAFVFMKAKMYEDTARLLQTSMSESGRSAERLHLLALALNRLGRADEASGLLAELLERQPTYWKAMAGTPGTAAELVPWLLALDGDEAHLDHVVLRLSVAALMARDGGDATPAGPP